MFKELFKEAERKESEEQYTDRYIYTPACVNRGGIVTQESLMYQMMH